MQKEPASNEEEKFRCNLLLLFIVSFSQIIFTKKPHHHTLYHLFALITYICSMFYNCSGPLSIVWFFFHFTTLFPPHPFSFSCKTSPCFLSVGVPLHRVYRQFYWQANDLTANSLHPHHHHLPPTQRPQEHSTMIIITTLRQINNLRLRRRSSWE